MHDVRVLVLDDDAFLLDLMTGMLHDIGVTDVRSFVAAEAALSALDMRDTAQVAICDLNMPGMDGIEFLRHLAANAFAGGVIVLSGEDARTLHMVEQLGHAHRLKFLGALQKPVERAAVVELLNQICPDEAAVARVPPRITAEELRAGIDAGELLAYYQPQVEVATRRFVGVEVLARWQHPRQGLLGPDAFIELAEECELMMPLTEAMLRQSLRQWREWKELGLELGVSLNVSMSCLSQLDFPERLVFEAMAAGMPLDNLLLEITESRVMQDTARALDVLSRLCLRRIRLSIDDFGTAYSNMEKLHTLPFCELKIDRAFVQGAEPGTSSEAIVEHSAALGRRLGLRVVAEGVETLADWQVIQRKGCDLAQGYYVARPMPGAEIPVWAQQWQRRVAQGAWGQ